MAFSFQAFTDDVRGAAKSGDPDKAVRELLERVVSEPDRILAATPNDGDDEVMLFEDESVSIWRCKFHPHVYMPPHEHKIPVHIAGYAGGEKSLLYRKTEDGLSYAGEKTVRTGEVVTFGPDAIHAVIAEGDDCSHALHVYMGPLMTLTRGLFDWENGTQIDFTLENFDSLKRTANEMPNFA